MRTHWDGERRQRTDAFAGREAAGWINTRPQKTGSPERGLVRGITEYIGRHDPDQQ